MIKEQLEKAQTNDTTPSEVVMNLNMELCSAYREEELYWKQKPWVTWLKEGDRNTRFFHATTKQRRACNRITKLNRPDGMWAGTEDDIERTATDYFQNLFTSSRPQDFENDLQYTTAKITPALNRALTQSPSKDDIKRRYPR